MPDPISIAIAVFPRLTALDAIGPYEVLQRIPQFDLTFVGHERGEVRTENGMLGLTVDAVLEDMPSPDVLIVPGGVGSRPMQHDERMLAWVRGAHASSRWTTSVCTGSLVLGAAGLLSGLTATSHWATYAELEAHGATAVADRVVEHAEQRIITAAGVSSGIDMAIRLTELLLDDTAAQAAQLLVEYDPQPPFDAGAPGKVSREVLRRAGEYAALRD